MRPLFKLTLSLLVGCFGLAAASSVHAATKSICAAGCDFATLGAAFTDVSDPPADGDIYEVQGDAASPYLTASESWPINFPNVSSTVTCTGGAVISQLTSGDNRVYLSTSSTVQACTFGNVMLATATLVPSEPISGVRIVDNTFSTVASSSIAFLYGGQNFSILNNTNLNMLRLMGTSTQGVIQNNTFYGRMAGEDQAAIFSTSVSSSQLLIAGNTFSNRSDYGNSSLRLVVLEGSDLTFATNTINYPTEFITDSIDSSLMAFASGANYFGGNFIDSPRTVTNCSAISVTIQQDQAWNGSYTFAHNTIRQRGGCSNGNPLVLGIQYDRPDIVAHVEASYNLIYNATTTSGAAGIGYTHQPLNVFTQNNAYNGAYGFGQVVRSTVAGGPDTDVSDATSVTAYPFLKVDDVSTTNDLETAAFSPYVDVNGALDIGASTLARRNTISIDDTGVIDYTTVDATSTSAINQFVRSGDSITLAAGSYVGFSVSSTSATTSVSIVGAGNSTLITAASNEDGVLLSGVASSTLSGVRITGVAAGDSQYALSKMLFSFGGTDYDDAIVPFGVPANTMLIAQDGDCNIDFVMADGYDLTALTAGGTETFHVALVDIVGSKLTMLVPDSVANSGVALDAVCFGIPIITEAFIDNLFIPTGGNYAYDSSSVVSAAATLMGGLTDPPVIERNEATLSAIALIGSSGTQISSVTTTANFVGLLLSGTTANVTISDSVIQGSTEVDLVSSADGLNTFDNVSFNSASTAIDGLGSILVKYDVQVLAAREGSATGISGASVAATDAGTLETSLGGTDGTGYTTLASLPAHVMTSTTQDLAEGGYNPYSIAASAVGYAGTSTPATISSRNQLITLYLISTTASNAPTSAGAAHVSTSTATFGWIDNSDDEDSFSVEYRRTLMGEEYPGMTTSVSGVAAVDITDLSPGEQYEFRVAAVNLMATSSSAYATSAVFTMSPNAPTAPTLTALSRTSLSIDLGTNSNATSVEYAIYSSTLSGYLDALAAVTGGPVWQTSSTWSTITVPALTCGTTYTFAVIARNVAENESATSTASSVATSACASAPVSSGGGGGGGGAVGGGGGASGPIQTFFTTTQIPPLVLPTSTLPTAPAAPAPAPSEPAPAIPGAPTAPTLTLEQFIQAGGNTGSRALGRGEREAVIRDLQEILGRTAANLPVADLDRISNGQIPLTRNLAYERLMVPRALATFRTMFGHAPNFQNQAENLAWNTLMYRIRFPRNLVLEREGIVEYRRTFRGAPQTPFQWAVVRVLGYVR